MTADVLLSRLDKVRKAGPGKWTACCPSRDDKSPSLSIRELDDGTVLLHDFGGDDVETILAAVGLTFSDLYPESVTFAKPQRRPFIASDVLELVAFESSVAVLVCVDVLAGRPVLPADLERLKVAARRLADASETINGSR